jgi:PPK2 family polyphosphate:nucleotide phosphotransferase
MQRNQSSVKLPNFNSENFPHGDAMSTAVGKFQVKPNSKVKLKSWPTLTDPVYKNAKDYKQLLQERVTRLSAQQSLLYASNQHAVLLIFQAMDAAGKDGAIKHVMSGINPQGCSVHSFKAPSANELSHDFLWRTTCALPPRGTIGIFNRSYYEEVLVAKVHPSILKNEGITGDVGADQAFWDERYRSINNLERHLAHNGTVIMKFYLNMSKQEQARRFLARIDDADKNWKFSDADLKERGFWPDYMKAYEECLSATSTKEAPWYVVPADDKENARLIVSGIVMKTLEALKMEYPRVSPEQRQELLAIRDKLVE